MNSSKKRKIVLGGIFIVIFCVIFLATNLALAQGNDLANPTDEESPSGQSPGPLLSKTGEKILDRLGGLAVVPALGPVAVMAYALAEIVAGLLTLAAYFVDFALELNKQIFNNPIVTVGWKIVLNFANLGFVLAIIVIAFATILRRETYAIKQTLGKLIVAALLVNFSLVIAGGFIDVANLLSQQFLDSSQLKTYGSLSAAISGIINPQSYLEVKKDISWWQKAQEKMGKALDLTTLSGLINFMFDQLMIGGLNLFAFLVMLLFGIMLLIRFIALSILLTISPIVWVLWIFPGTKKNWDLWWSQFFCWTFFAPVSLFFLFLVITAGKNLIAIMGNVGVDPILNKSYEAASGLSRIEKLPFKLLVSLTILGFIVAAIFTSKYLGCKGGKGLLWLAKKGGKKFGGWSGRMVLRGGTGLLRKTGGPEGKPLAQRFQERTEKMGWLGRQTLGRLAGRAAQLSDVGIRGQMAQYEKQLSKMGVGQIKSIASTAIDPLKRTLAEISLAGKGIYDVDRVVGVTDDSKKRYAKFNKSKEYENAEAATGGSHEVREAVGKFAAADENRKQKGPKITAGETDAYIKAEEEAKKKAKDWYDGLSTEQQRKVDHKKLFGSKPAFGSSQEVHDVRQEVLSHAIMSSRPETLGMVARQIPGGDILKFTNMMRKQFKGIAGDIGRGAGSGFEKLSVVEGKELKALEELLHEKSPELHWKYMRAKRGFNNLAQHTIGEGIGGGRAPKEEKEEKTT